MFHYSYNLTLIIPNYFSSILITSLMPSCLTRLFAVYPNVPGLSGQQPISDPLDSPPPAPRLRPTQRAYAAKE